jgi:hypothetical protein
MGYMRHMARWVLRVLALLVMIGLPVAAIFTGGARIVPFLAMPLFVLGGPFVASLARGKPSEPDADSDDDGDSDDGGGGNRRPDRGPTTPSGPTGKLPMEKSQPARWRQRGNGPQRINDPGRRRQPHRSPSRTPRRVPAGPHTR